MVILGFYSLWDNFMFIFPAIYFFSGWIIKLGISYYSVDMLSYSAVFSL